MKAPAVLNFYPMGWCISWMDQFPAHQYDENPQAPPNPRPTDFATQWNAMQPPLGQATELREYAPKIVTFYMKKGGVGKTSTTLSVTCPTGFNHHGG